MSVLSKGIYRFSELPFKILVELFMEAGKYPKVYMESQRISNIQSILKQEEQVGSTIFALKLCYKDIVIEQYGKGNSK